MTMHATVQRTTDELRGAFAAIVRDVRAQLGPSIAAALIDVQMRFARDWAGDDAAYVDFVFESEPALAEVSRLRDALVDRAREAGLPFMVYVSPMLREELDASADPDRA